MVQAKFTLSDEQLAFVEKHRAYGFKDRSELVRSALSRLQQELELQTLEKSARLYEEVYAEDAETQAWVEDARQGWPE